MTASTGAPTPAHELLLAWPATPLPSMFFGFRLPDAALVDGVIGLASSEPKAILFDPGGSELYLDLINLDLGADEDLLEFVRDGGFLAGGFASPPNELGPFDGAVQETARELRHCRHNARRRFQRNRSKVARYLEVDHDVDEEKSVEVAWNFFELGVTIEGVRAAAACFRDLWRCYRWAAAGQRPGAWESPLWRVAPDLRPRNKAEASAFLALQLSLALRTFAPKVAIADPDAAETRELRRSGNAVFPLLTRTEVVGGDDRRRRTAQRRYGFGVLDHHVEAYEVCCLQLFNQLVSTRKVRTCECPDCPNVFVRGVHRDGTLRLRARNPYCSDHCYDVMRKRDERDGKREQRDGDRRARP